MPLTFHLLGPVTATRNGQPLNLGGAKPRAVLAALLYKPTRPYPTEELLRDIWGEHESDGHGDEAVTGRNPEEERRRRADKVFQYIRRLKTALAVDGQVRIITNRGRGYQILVPDGSVDWLHHQALVTRARAVRQTDPATALDHLRKAIGMWHGPPLQDLGPNTLTVMRQEMTAQYAGAVETWAELELDHGQPATVIERLDQLTAEQPTREHTAALLIRALRRAGRRGDAAAVFERTRAHAADSYGLNPDGELVREYTRTLGDDQLTAAQHAAAAGIRTIKHFVGRDTELEHLAILLTAEQDAPQVVVICAVDGMPGVGKTELAYQLISRIADQFPDGIHEIDLHGWTPGQHPLDPAEALDRLLRRLGVPGPAIPESLEERATLYRRRLADQRSLILLDNARNSTQVHALLPAASGCRVIVTGRRRFTALDEAHTLHLDVLHPDAAVDLGPPRFSRTVDWVLVHAADCRFRNSWRASNGVLYPSPEWRRLRL